MERSDPPPTTCEEPHVQEGESTHRLWRSLFATFVILLIVYPLSLGPVTYLHIRGFVPSSIIEPGTNSLYRPLWRFSNSGVFLAGTYKSYLDWWIVRGVEQDLKPLMK